jgi:hypothetical protein
MDVSPASGMRNLPPGEREAARGSVPDRLATGQAVHADAPPTPIVDEALKRLAKSIKEHFIDPFDQFSVTVQFDRVKVEAALVLDSDPPLELCRDHREGDGRRRRDDVLGQRIDPGKVPRAGIHQQMGDTPETVGSWQLFHLLDKRLQLGAARYRDRQLRRRGTEHEPLHRVRLAVGGELGVLLGRVRALTVETASDVETLGSPSKMLNLNERTLDGT